ncbi:hypothetical protein A3C87_03195 [Candidatus Kaiserbacteria bacterium RIFCSPHIGHO2_02_FULL_49_34]|uniref:Glycosyltransferase 2-like domain-containing protein n=1 Tax=Candidatus Kaiserbacteria bacterium RIFCSPHIGHO2_02_FULL_49_34 TaxID=1798491 RepID=A0A1F6DIB2_9BACT|nr:MAG: hypothetical protein A3C87_03195 [Candidatus Kaiserbacteria bacterium RIFCSPHIGHO2_02_FULL_49_34]
MNITPTITIAIPSYNKEPYIRRCLESALNNQNDDVEIILVDNASQDATYKIAQSYTPTVTCHQNSTNLGMASNWNKCIEHASGDWILILHADDELAPNVIPLYRTLIMKNPNLGIIHANSFAVVNGDPATKTTTPTAHKEHWRAGEEALRAPIGLCSTIMVKKEAYERLGGFIETSLSADAEMWPRVAAEYDLAFINEPTATYHYNKDSTGAQSLIERRFEDIVADWDNLTEKIAQSQPTEELRLRYLAKAKYDALGNYWAIVAANLKTRKYKNATRAIWIISVHYHKFFPLLQLIIKKLWSKR